jgi:hypothetical protein
MATNTNQGDNRTLLFLAVATGINIAVNLL